MSKKTVAEDTDSALDALLNTAWDELPQEKNLPTGPWLVKGRNIAYVAPKEGTDGDPKVLAFLTAVEPGEGVDEDKLTELGDYDFSQNDLTYTMYIEKPSDLIKKVVPFLDKFGIAKEDYPNLKAAMKAFKNAKSVCEIGERSYTNRDGETVTVNSLSHFTKIGGDDD